MSQRRSLTVAMALATGLTLSACSGAGGGDSGGGEADGGDGGGTVRVLQVNNPQMVDLEKLTADFFTPETGINVEFTTLPENDVRDQISQEFSAQAGQYDVASLSNFEIPIYAENGWVANMDDYISEDSDFNQDDILPPMAEALSVDGSVYGQPFYGESSFTMYRKDVFEEQGVEMPENPTWDDIAGLAEQLDGAEANMSGICLRGLPGWGQVLAPMTTVVNTFGGTYWTEDWEAQVDSPEFNEAVTFYTELIKDYGQDGAAQAGFTECLNNLTQGDSAMWVDATSAAGSLEAEGSPVAGKIGYAPSPVKETDSSGWLYTWAWGIEEASPNKDAAWEFISWASSQEYEELVGAELGWSGVPAGKRASTYENEDYLEVAGAFAEPQEAAISNADPGNPGVQARPAPGIQFVGVPEFPDFGTQFSQDISSVIAGQMSVDEALSNGQRLAEGVAESYQE
ncbi:MAG: sugar ABC transporter substrate-binding protein [Ornithinimicrobium sp.]